MVELSQILIVVAIIGFAFYIFRLRSILFDRLIYLFLIAVGIAFAIHPPLSSWLATKVGIGRGTDLIIYVFILFSLFQMVSTSSHSLKQDRQITLLVRECAILGARRGGAPDASSAPSRTDHAIVDGTVTD